MLQYRCADDRQHHLGPGGCQGAHSLAFASRHNNRFQFAFTPLSADFSITPRQASKSSRARSSVFASAVILIFGSVPDGRTSSQPSLKSSLIPSALPTETGL